jgi:hypothetical protein
VFVELSVTPLLEISALTSPKLTVTTFFPTVVFASASTPPTDARTSPLGTAVVIVELLEFELLVGLSDNDVVVGSSVFEDGEIVDVVEVVGGELDVTTVREPVTILPEIPPV